MDENPKWLLVDEDYFIYDGGFLEFYEENGIFNKEHSQMMAIFDRWENYIDTEEIVCPHCSTEAHHYLFTDQERVKCRKCRINFSIRNKTYLDNSKLGYEYWYRIAYLLGELKMELGSRFLARDLCLSQKTTFYMLRTVAKSLNMENVKIPFRVKYYIDATYIMKKLLSINKNKYINLIK